MIGYSELNRRKNSPLYHLVGFNHLALSTCISDVGGLVFLICRLCCYYHGLCDSNKLLCKGQACRGYKISHPYPYPYPYPHPQIFRGYPYPQTFSARTCSPEFLQNTAVQKRLFSPFLKKHNADISLLKLLKKIRKSKKHTFAYTILVEYVKFRENLHTCIDAVFGWPLGYDMSSLCLRFVRNACIVSKWYVKDSWRRHSWIGR